MQAAIGMLLVLAAAAAAPAHARRPPWRLPPEDFGGATPLNRSSWYEVDDYPAAAARAKEQGYVIVSYEITAGQVGRCEVIRSSGRKRLDRIPCRLLRKRARFAPARSPDGTARATRATSAMMSWLPHS